MTNITNWDVLHKLRPEFVSNIKIVCFLNQNSNGVIIITKDDEVFGFGDFNYFKQIPQHLIPVAYNEVEEEADYYDEEAEEPARTSQPSNNPFEEPIRLNELSGKQIISVSHGLDFTIALSSSGFCYSWGLNNFGQLGDNSIKDKHKPALIESLKNEFITDISCGEYHSIVLTKTEKVYGFGQNIWSQLGLNHRTNQLNPILIKGFNSEKVIAISCSSYHSIALTDSGHVFRWGYEFSNIPEMISFDSEVKIVKISSGLNHSLLLTNNGVVYGFGCNQFSQLGNNECLFSKNPIKIKTWVKFIEIGSEFRSNISIAKSDNGFCYIWGQNNSQIIISPIRTPFNSIHDFFSVYSCRKYSYKPIIFDDKIKCDSILSQLENAFNDMNSSDFLFKIEDKVIYTHKAILKIRCKYFRTLFLEKWDSNDVKEIVIQFYSYPVYYAFLKYIYTDLVDIEVKDIFNLCDLAINYSEIGLKVKCFEIIKNNISVNNVVNWYEMLFKKELNDLQALTSYSSAVKNGLNELENIYVKFIASNLNDVCNSSAFRHLDSNLCKRILLNATKLRAFNYI